MPGSISIRQFARLDGCDESLVRRAVRLGRLHLDELGGLDPSLAGTGWRRGNRKLPARCPACKRPFVA